MSGRLWGLLLVLSGNMLIDALEVSTTVVAMPSIARDLHLTAAAASGLMVAFAVGFGGSVVAGSRLTGRHGRRRAYLIAMFVFALASLAAGLAPDAGTLLATRLVKGACVALTAPTGIGIIAATFPAGRPRSRAMSVYSLFGASGFSGGLVVSGALTTVDWRWAMVCGAPVAFVLYLAGTALIPRDEPAPEHDTRPAVQDTSPAGWGRVARETAGDGSPAYRSEPLLRSAAGAAALNGSFWGFLYLVTFDLQARGSFGPWATGLALLPASLPLAVATPYAGRLATRLGTDPLIVAGAAAAVAGYGWYFSGHFAGYPAGLLPAVCLIGAAFTLSFTPLNLRAVSAGPPGRQGAIGAAYQTAVQLGGAAVLASVASVPHRLAPPLVVGVALAGLAVAVDGLVRHGARHGTASEYGKASDYGKATGIRRTAGRGESWTPSRSE